MNIKKREVVKVERYFEFKLPSIIRISYVPARNISVLLLLLFFVVGVGSFSFKDDSPASQEERVEHTVTENKKSSKKKVILSEDKNSGTKVFKFEEVKNPDFVTTIQGIEVKLKFPHGGKYGLTKEHSRKFIKELLPACVDNKKKWNVPLSVQFYQMKMESDFGMTRLGKQGNYLGIKRENKYTKGTTQMKDDFTWKSTFGTYAGNDCLKAYGETFHRLKKNPCKNNPYKGGWSFAVYLYELQHPYSFCKKCDGYGCPKGKGCGGSGLIGKVYATGKYPGKRANPEHYVEVGITFIPANGFETIDLLYQEAGDSGINKLINQL